MGSTEKKLLSSLDRNVERLILKCASLNIIAVTNPPNLVTACLCVCALFTLVIQRKYF